MNSLTDITPVARLIMVIITNQNYDNIWVLHLLFVIYFLVLFCVYFVICGVNIYF
jgi:hypothetical protein